MAELKTNAPADSISSGSSPDGAQPPEFRSMPGSSDKEMRSINTDSLRLGMRTTGDLYDPSGVLLLAAGSTITPRFLFLMHQRSLQTVQVEVVPEDGTSTRAPQNNTDQIDRAVEVELSKPDINAGGLPPARSRLAVSHLAEEAERVMERRVIAGDVLRDLCESVERGTPMHLGASQEIIQGFLDSLSLDADLLTTVAGMKKGMGDYQFDHAVNGCLFSMTLARQLGLRSQEIQVIGLGALLRDVGMQKVPEEIRLAPRSLNPEEIAIVQRHPIFTLDYLEKIRSVPQLAKIIGYQSHERLDCSGYPRKRRSAAIHPFAKIVGIADAYAAMAHPRPHRPAMIPHQAVRQILQEGAASRFDRALLRAFLDCLSAFPTGSIVELNTGLLGKVVRANPGAHTRPVILEVDTRGKTLDRLIDLSQEPSLTVVRAH